VPPGLPRLHHQQSGRAKAAQGPRQRQFLVTTDREIEIYIPGPLHWIVHLLPHCKPARERKGLVINNGSDILGLLPFVFLKQIYNAHKESGCIFG
jgi:hypothetical protein